ncbi:GNAT family N-acetyltransferase [Kordia sp. YSTF-M3]|uniref:GNAT family N-acetyltransferase n=1 Tax=Kordia aestuariivivens TaxID=2759037 RepID=A0ABR7QCJ6_9FLAO|nr:GNAT family N-acetyltransferase [Kordia aestuariivivens]MBC8756296.1 GNAT family N-acetyltransferase [Kordia aestuariivivens]
MIIHVGNITMERFLPEHTDKLYDLINSPEVRKGMRNSAVIPYESHVSWVKANLIETENTHLFIVIDEDKAKGVVLIKNIADGSGELGIMVNDILGARRTLLTSKLVTGILYYCFHILNFETLHISIIPENINSLTIAKKIGADYKSQDETYQHFLLKKSKYLSSSLNTSLIKRYKPVCIK